MTETKTCYVVQYCGPRRSGYDDYCEYTLLEEALAVLSDQKGMSNNYKWRIVKRHTTSTVMAQCGGKISHEKTEETN